MTGSVDGDNGGAVRLKMRLRAVGVLLKQTSDAWVDDDVPRLAASLAFYTVLSLIPCLILITAIAARVLGQKAAQGDLMRELHELLGSAGAQAIQELIQSASKSSTAATVLGSFTLIFGASAVVMELRDALNTIWNVPAGESFSSVEKFLRLVRDRFSLFGLIFGAGLVLLVLVALNAFVAAASALVRPVLPFSASLGHAMVFFLSFAVVTALFATVYKVVPDVQLSWQDVIVGACFTSLLFTIGKQLIGIYLGRVNYGSTYGAAGSLLIILVWVYYSAQLFFFGAEFTKIYANKMRRRPVVITDAITDAISDAITDAAAEPNIRQ